MTHLVLGNTQSAAMTSDVLNSMFKFRFEVFYEKLGWDVGSSNSREIDEYDRLNPHYLISLSDQNTTNGCWRLLPTVGPYMLRDTFPQLLRGEQAPAAENIWELSRFAVSAQSSDRQSQIALNATAMQMMQKLIEFADKNNIDEYVTVMSVAVERLMKRAGIPMQRFGDGKSEFVGKTRSVASRIPVTPALRAAVSQSLAA